MLSYMPTGQQSMLAIAVFSSGGSAPSSMRGMEQAAARHAGSWVHLHGVGVQHNAAPLCDHSRHSRHTMSALVAGKHGAAYIHAPLRMQAQ